MMCILWGDRGNSKIWLFLASTPRRAVKPSLNSKHHDINFWKNGREENKQRLQEKLKNIIFKLMRNFPHIVLPVNRPKTKLLKFKSDQRKPCEGISDFETPPILKRLDMQCQFPVQYQKIKKKKNNQRPKWKFIHQASGVAAIEGRRLDEFWESDSNLRQKKTDTTSSSKNSLWL